MRRAINPEGVFDSTRYGFSQAVVSAGTRPTTSDCPARKAALTRLPIPEVAAVLRPRIDEGRVAVAATTWLEIGFAAQSRADHDRSQRPVLERLQIVHDTPKSERRAITSSSG